MIEPGTSLALSVHANPGVYALLLGSGISRAAKIPTGWEVVEDLIRKVACASGEICGPDPEAWYHGQYGTAPTYSGLLAAVGKSAAERSRILKSYFEPNDEELENGDKQPTKAHQAIARLVKRGTVRVILTTNFDRLLEQALAAEGISPSVISTPEAVTGAIPLAHSDCTVLKLHGDYVDLKTKNTPVELSKYDERVDKLLDRVFDEYGLIVCGWSGEWDTALRDAIKRCKNRRFTMWWAAMGKPARDGQDIIDFCRAQVIPIKGADEFFEDLSERLAALDQFARPHPIPTKIAVEQTKKYMSEPKYRIKLHDLLMGEVEKIVSQVCSDKYPVTGSFQDEDYAQRLQEFEAISQTAMHIVATGAFWDQDRNYLNTWLRAINILANIAKGCSGNSVMINLRRHPARLLMYAAGLSFVENACHVCLFDLMSSTRVGLGEQDRELLFSLTGDSSCDYAFKLLFEERRKVPLSDHMCDILRPAFIQTIPRDEHFQQAFDRYEALQSLYSASERDWAIPSAFMYRGFREENSAINWLIQQAKENGEESGLLNAGFCNQEKDKFDPAIARVVKMAEHIYFK